MSATTLLSEDFVDTTGWTVTPVALKHHATTWVFDNPGSRNLPPLVEPFAIADSDIAQISMDTTLTSPVIDASGLTCVELALNHFFRANDTQTGDVDVRSSATGGAWVTLETYVAVDDIGAVSFDLTPYAAADLQVAFHFYNAVFDWYWGIDDVVVRGTAGSIFADGFESGGTTAWSATVPP